MIADRPGKYFSWDEVTRSSTASRLGLDNAPDETAQWNAMQLCKYTLDPFREYAGPLNPTSWYRSPAVNKAVGGSRTSLHMRGLAADLKSRRLNAEQLARAVLDAPVKIPFDQLIWYAPERGGHIHIHIRPGLNRRQIMYAPKGGGYKGILPR